MFLLPLVGFTGQPARRRIRAASVDATESAESVVATDAFAAARAAPWSGTRRRGLTMIHPDIYAALARERTSTFLARAETARLARQLRPAARERPDKGRQVRLRDGSAVLIRPVRPADDGLLADGFARLSDRSRRMRFLGPKEALSAAELRYFTDVDHRDHEALGALDHARGGGVGIARYLRDRDDPRTAEIGADGVRRVVERDLTEAELAGLRTAAEAVRAKQADVASL